MVGTRDYDRIGDQEYRWTPQRMLCRGSFDLEIEEEYDQIACKDSQIRECYHLAGRAEGVEEGFEVPASLGGWEDSNTFLCQCPNISTSDGSMAVRWMSQN